jgi:two-component system cell cycle sensor histidine kinase/response regulator CckA
MKALTILTVEDNPISRKLLRAALESNGCTVVEVGDGRSALAAASLRQPDLVIVDQVLPDADGVQLLGELRHQAGNPELPAMVMTRMVSRLRELRATSGPFTRILSKPLDLAFVADLVRAHVAACGKCGPDEAVLVAAGEPQARELAAICLSDAARDVETPCGEEAGLERARRRPPADSDPAAPDGEPARSRLERQTTDRQALLRLAGVQATAVELLRSLAAVLARPQDLPTVIGDILIRCMDAAGLSTGLLYLAEPGSGFRLQAYAGIQVASRTDAEECFGHSLLIARIAAAGEPVALPSTDPGADAGGRDFLARLGCASALIVPFKVAGENFGALVLASDTQLLDDSAWLDLARNLAAHFGQTVALGHSLHRLALSEARYRALMEQAHDAILILDLSYRVVEANGAAQRLLGRPREEIVGRCYQDFVAPEELADEARRQPEPLGEGALRVESRSLLRADGARVPAEVSSSLVRLGEEFQVLAILRDSTERRRAELELREAQQRLEHVVSSSPAVLYTLALDDGQAVASWVSDNIERLTGDTAAEALAPGRWLARVHPADQERITLAAAQADDFLTEEFRLLHQSGSCRWICAEQVLIRDAAGTPIEAVGSWADITARKETELSLAQSEEQYRLLFSHNPQPMWAYEDSTLAFLAVNEAAVDHYGYSRQEFMAMKTSDLRPPNEVAAYEELVASRAWERDRQVFHSPRVWRHRRRDETLIDVETSVSPIELGRRRAWLEIVTDVSEKKRFEARFLQVQKLESVGRLAGGIAHDFNNLLAAILGYSELLAGRLRDPADLRDLDEIRKAGERAAGLTRQLLAFSRHQVLQPRAVDLNAVVVDIEAMLRRLIGGGIELVTAFRADAGQALVDPSQVEQVIVNLAVNARDAMPEGGKLILETAPVEIDATYAQGHPDSHLGPHVMIAFSDTGHGMDAETRLHIFEPFFTTKEQGKGTGLGLSTVYGIVQQSGGHIDVYSEPGRGTTFKVYFPRVDRAAESPARRTAAPRAQPRGSETVLLVEDEAALRPLLRAALEGGGYRVFDAASAEAALSLAGALGAPIDLLLTDLVMPGFSGPELASRLAAIRPELRVLFMSAYSGNLVGLRNVLPPGAEFLGKPFTLNGLLEKVREVLDSVPG